MIPAITPPTDNLYKFLSLFGLTIFLFSTYNLGIVYDQSALNKAELEGIKVQVQKKIFEKSATLNPSLTTFPTSQRFRPAMIQQQDEDLKKIEDLIADSKLTPIEMLELDGKVSRLSVKLDALWVKQIWCIVLLFAGIGIMIWGFLRWKKKEQNLRDKILKIEYDLKRNEELREKKKRKKKLQKALIAEEISVLTPPVTSFEQLEKN